MIRCIVLRQRCATVIPSIRSWWATSESGSRSKKIVFLRTGLEIATKQGKEASIIDAWEAHVSRGRKTPIRNRSLRREHHASSHRPSFALGIAVMLIVMTPIASAGPFTNVIVYGDSLSDNGNLYAALVALQLPPFPPSPPYYNGHFSNGQVAVEYLSNSLHVPLLDFAYGGATTGFGDIADGGSQMTVGPLGFPGMLLQVGGTLASIAPIAPSSLFVVWGGPNDYFSGGTVSTAVSDVLTIVGELKSVGATHILVPGMPDIGLTPGHHGDPNATAFSIAFNQGLQTNLPKGVTYFDTFGFFNQVVANPGAYGLTDVTDACFNGVTVCSNPSQYLFWDDVHPTTGIHEVLAVEFANAVPEPSTLLMLGTSVAGLAVILRRKVSG